MPTARIEPNESGRKFIRRERPPRVQIEYDSDTDTRGARELPFVIGVLADFSGMPAEPLPPVEARQFTTVDVDNFEIFLKQSRPRVDIAVPNTLTGEGSLKLELTFDCLEDFSPGAVVRKTEGLKQLYAARERLSAMLTKVESKAKAEALITQLLSQSALLRQIAEAAEKATTDFAQQQRRSNPEEPIMAEVEELTPAPPQTAGSEKTGEDYVSLLSGVVGARSDPEKAAVKSTIDEIARWAVAQPGLVVEEDAIKTLAACIQEIDRRLTEQVNLILHDDDFKRLEGTWRGLHHFVNNTETDELLQIKVLNISKNELSRSLRRFAGADYEQSPLFRSVHDQAFRVPNGVPFGCLIGDYYFDHSPADVDALRSMGQIAAAAQTPFLSGAAPGLLNLASWPALAGTRGVTEILCDAAHLPWQALRQTEDSRYLGLTLPRFLGRLPYGPRTVPVEAFHFEEDTEGGDHAKYVWCNAAYAMAANIARAFKLHGWCASIRGPESGGRVSDLPLRPLPMADGLERRLCPTEASVDERHGSELERQGLIVLYDWRNTADAVFFGAQSLQKPRKYEGSGAREANEAANLSARLPWLFPCCRFIHYIRCLARDLVGRPIEPGDLERRLQDWLDHYVLPNPEEANEELKARKPLCDARIEIQPVEGNPGYYFAVLRIQPHYQLGDTRAMLRIRFPLSWGPD